MCYHSQHRSSSANPNWTDRGDGSIDNHGRPSEAASRSVGHKSQSQNGSAECPNTVGSVSTDKNHLVQTAEHRFSKSLVIVVKNTSTLGNDRCLLIHES